MNQIPTRKFAQVIPFDNIAIPNPPAHIEQPTTPYRIGLKNQTFQSVLVFDLLDCITIGRDPSSSGSVPHIDLQPYNALELGVSRHHAILKREAERIFLIDNNSANGVLLNDKSLRRETSYPIGDGDVIKLGLLSLQLIFLINPFSAR